MKFVFSILLTAAFAAGIVHYNAGNYKLAMSAMLCAGYFLSVLAHSKED